jgi:hypothetical protein
MQDISRLIVGDSQIRESFAIVFKPFLEEFEKRQPLIEQVLHRELKRTSLLDRYLYIFGVRAYQDFKEVLTLMSHGLPTGALKIVRSLYERVTTMFYLSRHPEEIEAFVNYGAVHQRRLLNHSEPGFAKKYLPDEWVEQIEKNFDEVKKDFTYQACSCGREGLMTSWTKLDARSLALKSDPQLAQIYAPAFFVPTLHLHPTSTGLTVDLEETDNGWILNAERLDDRGSILASAQLLLYKSIELQNKYFELGYDAAVQEAIASFNELWKGTNGPFSIAPR